MGHMGILTKYTPLQKTCQVSRSLSLRLARSTHSSVTRPNTCTAHQKITAQGFPLPAKAAFVSRILRGNRPDDGQSAHTCLRYAPVFTSIIYQRRLPGGNIPQGEKAAVSAEWLGMPKPGGQEWYSGTYGFLSLGKDCYIKAHTVLILGGLVKVYLLRGDIKIPHSRMTKTYWETLATCLWNVCQKVTKGHIYHLLGVTDYYVMYRPRTQSFL